MHVRFLHLKDFRNYASLELFPSKGLNILLGSNAQGKTNLLESLYFVSTLRPLRAARDADLIRWESESALILLEFIRAEVTNKIEVYLSGKGKRMTRLNDQPLSRQMELIGRFVTICFTAQDLLLIRGEPSDRRRFLDYEIGLLSHRYIYFLLHYRRCLEHRNNLLRAYTEGHGSLETLAEWNQQLVRYGARLFHMRSLFLIELNQRVAPIHRELSGEVEQLALSYQPGLFSPPGSPDEESWTCRFIEELDRVQSEEQRRGTTLVGPHRDDVLILINGKDARFFASQGQQRTAALSLKLAEVRLVEDRLGDSPVVLLDDVFSDLDPQRQHYLMQFLQNRMQTFITCTDLSPFSDTILQEAQLLQIQGGRCFPYERT